MALVQTWNFYFLFRPFRGKDNELYLELIVLDQNFAAVICQFYHDSN